MQLVDWLSDLLNERKGLAGADPACLVDCDSKAAGSTVGRLNCECRQLLPVREATGSCAHLRRGRTDRVGPIILRHPLYRGGIAFAGTAALVLRHRHALLHLGRLAASCSPDAAGGQPAQLSPRHNVGAERPRHASRRAQPVRTTAMARNQAQHRTARDQAGPVPRARGPSLRTVSGRSQLGPASSLPCSAHSGHAHGPQRQPSRGGAFVG